MAKTTIENFIEKASRLYEQKRSAVFAANALEMVVRAMARNCNRIFSALGFAPIGQVAASDVALMGGFFRVKGNPGGAPNRETASKLRSPVRRVRGRISLYYSCYLAN